LKAGSRENVSRVSCAEPTGRGQTLASLGPRWTVTLRLCKGRTGRRENEGNRLGGCFHADRKTDSGIIGSQQKETVRCGAHDGGALSLERREKKGEERDREERGREKERRTLARFPCLDSKMILES